MVNNSRFISQFVQRWLPAGQCLLCGDEASRDLICRSCRADLPRNRPCCPICALTLPVTARCPACLRRPPPFTVHAGFRYGYPLAGLIQRLKFRGQTGLGHTLGELLLTQLPPRAARPQPDCILPMPLHWRRQLLRGYNQALELARPIAAELAIPLQPGLARRVRATRPQTALDSRQRRANLRQAFQINEQHWPLPARVAIVDDVMTSGQTVKTLANTLRRAGVEHVDVWVLARAG